MNQLQDANHILIRPPLIDDAQVLNQIITHPQVARTLLQLPSKELAVTVRMLRESQAGLYRLVATNNGEVVGMVTLAQDQNPRRVHSGSLGLMVSPNHWGQGIGNALIKAILDLSDNWLNLTRIELVVLPNNLVAIHLYEKFGFLLEGMKKFAVLADGRYQDQLVMARLRSNQKPALSATLPNFPTRNDVIEIRIRPLRMQDAADLYEMFTHPAVASGTNQLPSQELLQITEQLQAQKSGVHRYSAVAEHEDASLKIVGNLTLSQFQKARLAHGARIGMSVHPAYWGLGIGSKLLETAIDLADNWLGLKRVELEVLADNPKAIHLYRKFGFTIEGTKQLYSYGAGRWADAYFMARLNSALT